MIAIIRVKCSPVPSHNCDLVTAEMKNKRTSHGTFHLAAFLIFALVSYRTATAATITWTGVVSGNWNTQGNWSSLSRPGAADAVVFTGTPLNPSTNINGPAWTINSLSVSGSNFTISNTGNSLTVTTSVTNTGGLIFTSSGSVLFSGPTTNSGTLRTSGGTFTLQGTVNNTGGTLNNVSGTFALTNAAVSGGTLSGATAFTSNGTTTLTGWRIKGPSTLPEVPWPSAGRVRIPERGHSPGRAS